MNQQQDFEDFVNLVSLMREAQTRYFSNRTGTNMATAMKWERLVDEKMKKLNVAPKNQVQQTNLFNK